jgi:hypothetical protein
MFVLLSDAFGFPFLMGLDHLEVIDITNSTGTEVCNFSESAFLFPAFMM